VPLLAPQDHPRRITDEYEETDEARHDRLVITIARSRFAYPSKDSPSLRTYVNVPKAAMSVNVSRSESLFPDIVVANEVTKKAATIVEVETRLTIDNERALLWKKYAPLSSNIYLFVPQSSADAVRALASFFRVRLTALRIYSYNNVGDAIISSAPLLD
jgi:hypothetical protein